MASDPTFLSCWSQAALAVKLPNAIELFGNANTPNVADMEDALTTAIDGVYTPAALAVVQGMRARVAAAIDVPTLQALWREFLREMCRAVGLQELTSGNALAMLRAVRQYMVDNAIHIRGLDMTCGTPTAAGGDVGTGDFFRVTVDKDGYPLSTSPEAKTAKCVGDALSGTKKFAELWRLQGAPAGVDGLDYEGSGFDRTVESIHPGTGRIVANPSFDTNGASADNEAPSSTTAVSGWVLSSTAAFKLRSAAGYSFSSYPGAPATGWGLEFVLDGTCIQTLATANPSARFSPTAAHFLGIRYKRKASATGNLTFRVGSQSVVATIGSATNDVWNWLYIALDEDCYLQNFNETGFTVEIEVDMLATGTVVVDHVTVAALPNIDGTYAAIVSGATPALRDDSFSYTDAHGATRAIFAFILWRAFGPQGWLPSVEPATEIAASGGRTLTFANSGSADTITASSGSFITDGYKPGMLVTIAGSSSNDMTTGPLVTVTATVLTFGSGTALTNEGPVSATTTLNAAAQINEPA